MIVVCDVNTIWRHRPFAAMASLTDVMAVAPCDWLAACRRAPTTKAGPLSVIDVVLPLGWATKTAWLSQWILWRRIRSAARNRKQKIDCVVVTSPHYLPLLTRLPKNVKTVYYASDDFRSYHGWKKMAELEGAIVRRVDHSFFVSQGLQQRACREYGVAEAKVSVSMNGTEDRFFPAEEEPLPVTPPASALERPVAGVVGGINDRLDFGLLQSCADLPGLGTLLLVGPLPEDRSPELATLLEHPKCVAVGEQPHHSIDRWFKCLDVGLIPYAESDLNTFCSPMRLFDHLASNRPVVATSACEQVRLFDQMIRVCERSFFVERLNSLLVDGANNFEPQERITGSAQLSWGSRAKQMLCVINDLGEMAG